MPSVKTKKTSSKSNTEFLQIAKKLKSQIEYFYSGTTRDINFRIEQLKRLKSVIKKHESEIMKALYSDLKKSDFESYLSEIGFVYQEIDHAVSGVKKWSKIIRVWTPFALQPGRSWKVYEPYGQALIIAPWNYPFQLLIAPLVAAIAAGNVAVVKPSELSPATSKVISKIISETFDPTYVFYVEGGIERTRFLLSQKFDYIFFTGGTAIGKVIMEAASKFLTPVTLELGGKSPAIINSDASINLAAKKLVWGKFLNAGQTCIAPDYILVHSSVKDELLKKIEYYIKAFFGDDPSKSPDFPRIISNRHFNRLKSLLKNTDIIIGGETNEKDLYIAPTVMKDVPLNHPVMKEEIFGPLLPVIEFSKIEEVISIVRSMSKPLALYLYTASKKIENLISRELSSGGFMINDNLLHIANSNLPFGGVGDSGIGSYHGKYGFETFSHLKAVMKSSRKIDLPVRYPPYKNKIKLVKKIFG